MATEAQLRASIPTAKGLPLSRRYEGSIQRDFFRAYDRIARLQRTEPEPVNPIGFVSQPTGIASRMTTIPILALCLLMLSLLWPATYSNRPFPSATKLARVPLLEEVRPGVDRRNSAWPPAV